MRPEQYGLASLLPPACGGASCHTCPRVSVLRGALPRAPSKPAEPLCCGAPQVYAARRKTDAGKASWDPCPCQQGVRVGAKDQLGSYKSQQRPGGRVGQIKAWEERESQASLEQSAWCPWKEGGPALTTRPLGEGCTLLF